MINKSKHGVLRAFRERQHLFVVEYFSSARGKRNFGEGVVMGREMEKVGDGQTVMTTDDDELHLNSVSQGRAESQTPFSQFCKNK